jgi:two-component system chemotaxis sensor kinase CheA
MIDRSKYVDMFVEEAHEHLLILNSVLLDLEQKGFDKEQLNEAYRTVHTIKGSASVLGIETISDMAHNMEDLFDLLRGKNVSLEEEVLDLLFHSLDIIETMVKEFSKTGSITINGKVVIEQMKGYMTQNIESGPSPNNGEKRNDQQSFEINPEQKNQIMEAISEGHNLYELNVELKEKTRFKEGRVFQLLRRLSSMGYVISSNPDTKDIDDSIMVIKILIATKKKEKTLKKTANEITGIKSIDIFTFDFSSSNEFKKSAAKDKIGNKTKRVKEPIMLTKAETIRVKSKLLDQLLDLVGEIMISNIRVNQIANDLKHRELKQVLKNAERLIGELQDTVLGMRMVPVDHIFKRFPRMVRDMAKEGHKEVKFEIMGNDIEIDRNLLDEIGDILVHLLRNAVDHGIESADERKKEGKERRGNIELSALREQSNIVITIEDDGKGLDAKRILKKALKNNLITEAEVENLNEKQALNLAFQPGITTASKVTEISGRGVGLDVVKNKIEALGGTVRLDTDSGKGTKFTLKLPSSMSIISAMLVEVNKENYAIPLENVSETTKVSEEVVHEFAESGMFRLREEILPLLNIHSEFGGRNDSFEDEMPVIIVEKNDDRAGLIVTRFIGQQEIVVKNLSKDLQHTRYFSGATILGDGNVALILDVGALI